MRVCIPLSVGERGAVERWCRRGTLETERGAKKNTHRLSQQKSCSSETKEGLESKLTRGEEEEVREKNGGEKDIV